MKAAINIPRKPTHVDEEVLSADRAATDFVKGMSHELHTPLNVIIGLCQLLERDRQTTLSATQRDAVKPMGAGRPCARAKCESPFRLPAKRPLRVRTPQLTNNWTVRKETKTRSQVFRVRCLPTYFQVICPGAWSFVPLSKRKNRSASAGQTIREGADRCADFGDAFQRGNFNFIRERLGLDEAEEMIAGIDLRFRKSGSALSAAADARSALAAMGQRAAAQKSSRSSTRLRAARLFCRRACRE